jgi:hypothetical protein
MVGGRPISKRFRLIDKVAIVGKKDELFDELLGLCREFRELYQDSDMRPEDECHELYVRMEAAIKKAESLK